MTTSTPDTTAAGREPLSDRELLTRHVAGDPDAFAELFRRHRDRLWAVAVRTLSDPEEAADALQDAMISAFRNAGQFRGDSAVTTWLHRVVVNACLDRVRRRAVRAADPLPEDDRAAELAAARPPDPAEAQELRIDIMTALEALNPDQRAAIVLVDMEGYSVEEAAAILDCAPGTIKSRCARGRARLLPLLAHLRSADDTGRPGHQASQGNPRASSDVQGVPRVQRPPRSTRGGSSPAGGRRTPAQQVRHDQQAAHQQRGEAR